MYILKIKGKAKIPDYVQLRDDNFTLLAYFRVDRPEKALVKCGLGDREQQMIEMIREMPFGKVIKLDFDTTK
ncbi:MAG: fructose-6-phosphate aldolase [Bacteroidota bacterium]